jgi:Zn-dependent protease
VNFDITTIRDIIVVLVPMILSLSVHEFAHAYSAFLLGDDTASRQGRMTLNPIAHIDPIGTLIIPIFSVLFSSFSLIGWAKPVPVSPQGFNRNISMRNGMIITALAGPGSNIILALLFGGIAMVVYGEQIDALAPSLGDGRIGALLALGDARFVVKYAQELKLIGIDGSNPALMLLGRFFVINVFLAVFNMLPIPPLDGSRLLPLDVQQKMMRYTMFVFVGFIFLINYADDFLWIPAAFIGNLLLGLFGLVL